MNNQVNRFLKYLQFKMECAAYQEQNPVRFDRDRALKNIQELERLELEKIEILKDIMPKVPKYVERNRPKNTHKKDKTLSSYGEKWFRLLKEHKLPPTYSGPVKVLKEYEEPNPGSSDQVKAWLFSLGWEPCTFNYVKDEKEKSGERAIPQVRKDGELTESVILLAEKEPLVEHLAGLTVIQHRLGVFRGFLESCKFECARGCNGPNMPCTRECENKGKYTLKAEIAGLTNTLRFKHKKPLVNLPGVDKPWGEEIRSCLLSNEGEFLVGSDLVSLESTTKRHFIYPHDPEYAEEMGKEGFDEHLDLAMRNKAITQEELDYYKSCSDESDPEWKRIHKIRKEYKPVNYAAVYGVRPKRLNRTTGMSMKKAAELLDAYWDRNKSVKIVAEEQITKDSHGYTWLYNPVSGFWYELRYDKDRFSTLNQGTGVYVFDSWLVRCRLKGYNGQFQFHDETGASVNDKDKTLEQLNYGINKLNEDLNLNVPIKIDVKFGYNYAQVH